MRISNLEWRAMTGFDLGAVNEIAAHLHPGFYEAPEVLEEKLLLYRDGAHVLEIGERVVGYVFSHPWRDGAPPPLNTRLGAIPADADTYYLHDIAILPLARRVGAAGQILKTLEMHAHARELPSLSLVAVNGSAGYWARRGFRSVTDPALAEKLGSYGEDALYMQRRL